MRAMNLCANAGMVCWATASLSLSAATAHADLANPGPYPAGWRQVTITRANNTTFTARLFYPATSAGQNTPLNRGGGRYPAVSFGHGFFQPVSRYQSILEHLATHGFLVIATDSEGSLFPSHQNFANDISFSLTYLEQQNVLAGAFLENALHVGIYGLSGHSMGGGASILAAAADARIDAVATLAAAETNPSSTAAAANVRVPLSLISGTADTIVTSANNTSIFNSARAPKQAPVITGGWHCGYQDVSSFGCDSGPMTRPDQLARTRRLMTQWFTLYLKGDQSTWRESWGPENGDDTLVVRTAQTGIGLTPSAGSINATRGKPSLRRYTVSNTGPTPRALRVLVENLPAGWTFSASPAVTTSLATNASADVDVTITPAAGTAFEASSVLISARSELDLGTRAWTTLRVRAFCPSDFNRDETVDFFDYLDFVGEFAAESAAADFNGDGSVDFFDYLDFVAALAVGC
jgi:dienelactone hydrolase